ncbi:hypothetical protein [Rhizorhapis sp.]|uniref:hypothetical protein n=1 Tax=Rhizorhapis sp. TaxID=1968842 RepID=UPI002B499385|nr:hypothetical protein [Rhizorhapis sp.]HKR17818.1 hypothetical protein [Rhizorhapis sp.]
MVNYSQFGAAIDVSHKTGQRYVGLLEQAFKDDALDFSCDLLSPDRLMVCAILARRYGAAAEQRDSASPAVMLGGAGTSAKAPRSRGRAPLSSSVSIWATRLDQGFASIMGELCPIARIARPDGAFVRSSPMTIQPGQSDAKTAPNECFGRIKSRLLNFACGLTLALFESKWLSIEIMAPKSIGQLFHR